MTMTQTSSYHFYSSVGKDETKGMSGQPEQLALAD